MLERNKWAKISLNKDMIMYNSFKTDQNNLDKILTGSILIKSNIIRKKEKLEKKNAYTHDNDKFRKKLLQIINTRYKTLEASTE